MMTVTCKHTENWVRTCHDRFYGTGKEIDAWFEDQMVKDMILDIDQSVTVSPRIFENELFGSCSRLELSGGVCGLISILKDPDDREYNAAIFGDNCIPWIIKLSFLVDFTLCMTYPAPFIGDIPVNAVADDGTPLPTCRDLYDWYCEHDQDWR